MAAVQCVLDDWIRDYHIVTLPRAFGRTEIVVDPHNASFTEYIAAYYASQLLTGKYSSEDVIR